MRKDRPSELPSPRTSKLPRGSRMDSTSPVANEPALPPRHLDSLRASLAVIAGRSAGALSRRLHLGGGTSIAGVVAQRVYPEIVEHLATQLEHGSVIVTGTNGKTTTSSFIAAILRDSGLRVWRNREGSNLMRGVATSLVIRARPDGHLRRSGHAISILEADEAALSQIAQAVPPRVLVFTNLFRDQLDRYGEVDSIVSRWQQTIATLPSSTTLVLNADDPTIAHLGSLFSGKVLYYGIDDPTLDLDSQQVQQASHQVIDTRVCPKCGSEYNYTLRFYSHMGHYLCPQCGQKRPEPAVRATRITADAFDLQRVQVTVEQQHDLVVPLPGLYNIYNALAAVTAALVLDIDWTPIVSGIEHSRPVFGRGERIQADGRTLRLLLAKNPTGFNEVLRTLFSDTTPRSVLFLLNDNIADGRDISWIWDVDFERMTGHTQTLVIAGTRALDLALRLKYAGIPQAEMHIVPATPPRTRKSGRMRRVRRQKSPRQTSDTPSTLAQATASDGSRSYGVKSALALALQKTPPGETLFIVPTYTGLLEVHRELEQQGLTPHYWEGREA